MELYFLLYILTTIAFTLYSGRESKLSTVNNFVLACFTLVFLGLELFDVFIDFYGGYLNDSINFEKTKYGNFYYPKLFLKNACYIFPLGYLFLDNRKSKFLQGLIIGIFFFYLLLMFLMGENKLDTGWHTSMTERFDLTQFLIIGLVWFGFYLALRLLKFLPELQDGLGDNSQMPKKG